MIYKKISFLLIIFTIIFSACAGKPQPQPIAEPIPQTTSYHFFNSFPVSGGLVFIGAAARRRSADETLQLAVEDAARRAAIYQRITGEYAVENNQGTGIFDFSHDTYMALYYDQNAAAGIINNLQYDPETDILEMDNTLFVRTILPTRLPSPINYTPVYSGENKRPDWIDSPPSLIDGYEAGVGFSGRHSSMTNTYTNSFNNAIFAIIRNLNTVARSNVTTQQGSRSLFGTGTTNNNIVYSYGTLQFFYVLDTWVDPQNKTIWTLAIAKSAE